MLSSRGMGNNISLNTQEDDLVARMTKQQASTPNTHTYYSTTVT